MQVYHKNIPVYNSKTDKWSTRSFDSQKDFGDYLMSLFKEPGEYRFNASNRKWNEQGDCFMDNGWYTQYARGTAEYNDYWDDQENKCRLGVIWTDGENEWYTTRDYYHLINFYPMVNKEKYQETTFATIRDLQYHMSLYEKIAECYDLHSVILKKRQCMSSVLHTCKLLNFIWFENNKKCKMFASEESYLDTTNGSWGMIEIAKTHLNDNTDWYRGFLPGEYPEIKQIEKIRDSNNKWSTIGNGSVLVAKSLGKSPSSGVGGQNYFAFYEEAGVAPKLDQSLAFFEPAVMNGNQRVGSFCAAGSVGDLKDSKPLEKFMRNPNDYGFLAVPTKWYDDTGIVKMCGLFIPSQYGRPGCVDEYGNTDVEKGLAQLEEQYKSWESLPPEEMTLKMSQEPRTIKEAFATRTPNKFNPMKIKRRLDQIEIALKNKELKPRKGLLDVNKEGNIYLKELSMFSDFERPNEIGWPVDPKIEDKRGMVTIWEEPEADTTGLYFGGVDTVESDVTKTSPSLLSVHIYKRSVKVITYSDSNEPIITYLPGKIVATYRGRFNTAQESNEMGMLLIRYYNAFTAVESNKPNFINDARRLGFGKYIARENELPFNKDVSMTISNDKFGIYMDSSNNLRQKIEDNTIDYLNREYHRDNVYDNEGNIIKTIKIWTGLDYINDIWYLEELRGYSRDSNCDAFVSAGLAISLGMSRELDHSKTIEKYEVSEKKASWDYVPIYNLPQRNNTRNKYRKTYF